MFWLSYASDALEDPGGQEGEQVDGVAIKISNHERARTNWLSARSNQGKRLIDEFHTRQGYYTR